LDAVHAIVDTSAQPFLGELNAAVQAEAARLNRQVHLIAECDQNIRTVQPRARGGYGFGARWNMTCIEATPFENEKALSLRRWNGNDEIVAVFNFGKEEARVTISEGQSSGGAGWQKVLNSRDQCWGGTGPALPEYLPCGPDHRTLIEPLSVALYDSGTRGKT